MSRVAAMGRSLVTFAARSGASDPFLLLALLARAGRSTSRGGRALPQLPPSWPAAAVRRCCAGAAAQPHGPGRAEAPLPMRHELLRRAIACCFALGCAWTLWVRLGKVEQGVHRLGTHIILEVAGVNFDLLDNATLIPSVLRAAADAASLTVLDEVYHEFPVQGLSGLLLISESHLSYHTWPEHGYASVDLFTCGPPSPLPCRPLDTVRFDGATWACPDGTRAVLSQDSGLWAAVSLIVSALGAGGHLLFELDGALLDGAFLVLLRAQGGEADRGARVQRFPLHAERRIARGLAHDSLRGFAALSGGSRRYFFTSGPGRRT